MTNTTARDTSAGPTTGWMIAWSLWMLLVLIPGGVMTWAAFLVIGILGRNTRWTVSGIVYAVVAVVLSLELWEAWDIVLWGAYYVGSIIHALTVNPRWLALQWGRRERGESFAGVRIGSAAANSSSGSRADRTSAVRRGARSEKQSQATPPAEAEELVNAPGTDRSDYLSDAVTAGPPGSSRSLRAPGTSRTAARPAEPEPEPIDVNTASQRELSRLPGMDRRSAKAVVKARTERGGFASVEDFARTAGLQPHEIVRLRDLTVCSPRPRAARSFGRRLDL
ncbi:hypothetical protein GCM10027416_27650 [Okibacterium endophyticum]